MSELADTSAWVWTSTVGGDVRAACDHGLAEGELATCDMVRLELLHGTGNIEEFRLRRSHLSALPDCPIGPEQWHRALEVSEHLAGQGGSHHRPVKHPDLLIAAAAESVGVAVVHYDEDYDRIAAVTGQPTRWLAPRGSL
ncbi:MAG TPA: PIN domain-containing protein [Acidimicrobiales bacterium]|nr:PIN domain-containing protein [Acidimicrobiales bacterium]